jgi:hypothetical protein
MADDYEQNLEAEVIRGLNSLLGCYVQAIEFTPNTVLFVNADRIDPRALCAAIASMPLPPACVENFHVVAYPGRPEVMLMTRQQLEEALAILNGETS